MKSHVITLARAFAALTKRQFANLRRNVRRKDVEIACGYRWATWCKELDEGGILC